MTDKGLVTKIDVKTGKQIWQTELEKARMGFSASPILAGNHVYLTREDGVTFVIKEDDGEIVSKYTGRRIHSLSSSICGWTDSRTNHAGGTAVLEINLCPCQNLLSDRPPGLATNY